jgi:hypothetical protein
VLLLFFWNKIELATFKLRSAMGPRVRMAFWVSVTMAPATKLILILYRTYKLNGKSCYYHFSGIKIELAACKLRLATQSMVRMAFWKSVAMTPAI